MATTSDDRPETAKTGAAQRLPALARLRRGMRLKNLVSLRDRPLAPLLAVAFCVMTGMGVVWSMLALFLEGRGAGASMTGSLLAGYGVARLLVNVPAGLAVERWGARAMIIFGLVVLAIGSFAIDAGAGMAALIVSLLLQGIGCAFFITAALAGIAELGTAETRVRDMSVYQAANMVGISLGPGIGGLSVAAFGATAPFIVQGILALIGIGVLMLAGAGQSTVRRPPAKGAAPPESRWALLAAFGNIAMMIYGVIVIRVAGNWVLMPLLLRQRFSMSVATIGVLLTVGALANLVILPGTTWLARRYGRAVVILVAGAITTVSMLLLALGEAPALAWIAAALLGAGTGAAAPTLSAYVADMAPPGRLGSAMAMLRTVTDIGVITGPVLAGLVVDRLGFGYEGAVLAAGGLIAALTLIFGATTGFGRRASGRGA